jgi:molybdopterin-synthase adenylyltransferase
MAHQGQGDAMTSRFARQELVAGFDTAALAAATVVVLGVGALGNEVSRLLAMAGVGRLILCDPDVVSESNLNRAVLFRERDIGLPKVEVAARALADLAPHTRVETREQPLISGVGLAELRAADLVVSCLDSRAARISITDRCAMVGVGLLDAGTGPWGGEIRYYRAGGTCYGCLLSPADRLVEDDPHSCSGVAPGDPAGASAPVSAVIGAWQATVAIRLLCRLPVRSELLAVDLVDGVRLVDPGEPEPSCPLHSRIPACAIDQASLTVDASVAEIISILPPDTSALTWSFFTDSAGRSARALGSAPADARLRDLGVAPGEILPIVSLAGGPVRYLELAHAGSEEEA